MTPDVLPEAEMGEAEASLERHSELIRRLILDLETDSMGSEAVRSRVEEIQRSWRKARKLIRS